MTLTTETRDLPALYDLATLDIPTQEPREMGFLDVVDHATRENTINNIYRFFLDQQQSPALSNLLMESLLELVENAYQEKGGISKILELDAFQVHREYRTQKNGRIDLVLENKEAQQVVIIEVKVYHWLANDLVDYWDTFSYSDDQKIGIVLSLEPMTNEAIRHEHFVSITHAAWLNHARNKGLPHEVPLKELIYFNDFVNNMNHLTKSNEMNPEIEFYLKHAPKINKAIATRAEAFRFVIEQLAKVADRFDWKFYGSSPDWRHLWDEKKKATAYYVVLPNAILDEPGKVTIILELYSHAMQHASALRQHVKEEAQIAGLTPLLDGPTHVTHLFSKTYDLPPEKFETLEEVVFNDIEKKLEPIRKKMMVFLEERDAHEHK